MTDRKLDAVKFFLGSLRGMLRRIIELMDILEKELDA